MLNSMVITRRQIGYPMRPLLRYGGATDELRLLKWVGELPTRFSDNDSGIVYRLLSVHSLGG